MKVWMLLLLVIILTITAVQFCMWEYNDCMEIYDDDDMCFREALD